MNPPNFTEMEVEEKEDGRKSKKKKSEKTKKKKPNIKFKKEKDDDPYYDDNNVLRFSYLNNYFNFHVRLSFCRNFRLCACV